MFACRDGFPCWPPPLPRSKADKTGPVIGRGFQTLIDSVFWYLPFVSSKHAHAVREHAHAVREKADLPVNEEEWTKKFNLFAGEHKLEDVREQLRTGWKDWFAARNPGAAGEAWALGWADVVVADGASINMPCLVD